MTTNHIATFNDLVRECAYWQEAFDNWDEGITHTLGVKLVTSLDEVCDSWRLANAHLVRFVQQHGYDIMKEDGR